MKRLRRLALLLFLVGLGGCTEGQKTNPLPRASGTPKAETRPADLNAGPIAALQASAKTTEKH